MNNARNIPAWADRRELVSGFTTRGFGSLSARTDSPEAVEARFQTLAQNLKVEPKRMFTLPQTHSNNVAIIRDLAFLERPGGRRGYQASDDEVSPGSIYIDTPDFDMAWRRGVDGVILTVDDLFAVVLTADCAPVMFWEPESRICGIAHVGLVGAINQMATRMVTLMQQECGVRPEQLEAAILPSIRGCHYNLARSGVWQRLRRAVTAKYGEDNPYYRSGFFDLPGFIRWQLESARVQQARIHDSGICTVCQANEFFSHVQAGFTGTQEKEGRFGSIIGMRHTSR